MSMEISIFSTNFHEGLFVDQTFVEYACSADCQKDIHGIPCTYMEICGHPWKSMKIHGDQYNSIYAY